MFGHDARTDAKSGIAGKGSYGAELSDPHSTGGWIDADIQMGK